MCHIYETEGITHILYLSQSTNTTMERNSKFYINKSNQVFFFNPTIFGVGMGAGMSKLNSCFKSNVYIFYRPAVQFTLQVRCY